MILKYFQFIKESFDPKNLENYYQDLLDLNFELVKEGSNYFILNGKGNIEEVETFKERTEEFEKVKIYWFEDSKDQNTIKILCLDLDFYKELNSWMSELFKDVKFSNKKYYIGLVKPGWKYYLALQESKNGYFWCDYDQIWSVLESKFKLEQIAIQCFIKGWMDEHTKWSVNTPWRKQRNSRFYDECPHLMLIK